jgi:hypothetical protein
MSARAHAQVHARAHGQNPRQMGNRTGSTGYVRVSHVTHRIDATRRHAYLHAHHVRRVHPCVPVRPFATGMQADVSVRTAVHPRAVAGAQLFCLHHLGKKI